MGLITSILKDALNFNKSDTSSIANNRTNPAQNELSLEMQNAYNNKDFAMAEHLARKILASDPQQYEAHYTLGAIDMSHGDSEKALAHFRKALSIEPGNPNAIHGACAALGRIAVKQESVGNFKAAIENIRAVLHFDVDNQAAQITLANLMLRSGQEKGEISDYVSQNERELSRGKVLFIACMPKSGSTFLNLLIQSITGFKGSHAVDAFLDNEQDIHWRRIAQASLDNCVMQMHTRACQPTIYIMQAFGIKPVVLVRNLFDIVVSMSNYMDAGAPFPMAGFSNDYKQLDEQERINHVIDIVIPWYIGFYASWFWAEKKQQISVLWVHYEDLVHQPHSEISRILSFWELSYPGSWIEESIAKVNQQKSATRFNKGVSGRGVAKLSEDQKNRIRNLTRYYPSVDFSRVL